MNDTEQLRQIDRMMDEAHKMLRASSDVYTKALLKRYERLGVQIQGELNRLYNGLDELEEPSYADYLRVRNEIGLFKNLTDAVNRVGEEFNFSLEQHLVDQYKDAYSTTAWAVDQTTPESTDVQYALPPDDIIRQYVSSEWNGAMFSQRIGQITDEMAQDIQNVVNRAMMSGMSNKDLADKIEDVIGDEEGGAAYRSMMIARTETARASGLARDAFYSQNESIIEDYYWMSRSLSSPRLCEDCAERSGKSWDEVEEIDEEQGLGMDTPLHPNCSCLWVAKPKSFAKILGVEHSDADDPQRMTYQEWVKQYL